MDTFITSPHNKKSNNMTQKQRALDETIIESNKETITQVRNPSHHTLFYQCPFPSITLQLFNIW